MSTITNVELLGWQWSKGIFQDDPASTWTFLLPLLFVLVSVTVAIWDKQTKSKRDKRNQRESHSVEGQGKGDVKTTISASVDISTPQDVDEIDDDDDEEEDDAPSKLRSDSDSHNNSHHRQQDETPSTETTSTPRRRNGCMWRCLHDGLRVEWNHMGGVYEIMNRSMEQEVGEKQGSDAADDPGGTRDSNVDFQTVKEAGQENERPDPSSSRRDMPAADHVRRDASRIKIHPKSHITEQDVQRAYSGISWNTKDQDNVMDGGSKVVLVLRLASVFVSSGMSSIENESLIHKVAAALELPPLSFLSVGLNTITAQFALGPVINVSCAPADFYRLSLLSDARSLAATVIHTWTTSSGSRPSGPKQRDQKVHANKHHQEPISVAASLHVLDLLEDDQAANPYGWLIQMIAVYVLSTMAPTTVYHGGYYNLAWASIISVVIVLEVGLLQYLHGAYWETALVSFTTGVLSPILWQVTHDRIDDLEQCEASYTFGVLLIWLPGMSLVYGAHEISRGSYYNGSARLVKAIVQAMSIALFYTIGWQYWGRNWAGDETRNGEPTNLYNQTGPIVSLPPSIDCGDAWDGRLAWYMNSVVLVIPLNLASLILMGVRPRDCPGPFLVAQAVYALQGILSQWCRGEDRQCALPTYVLIFVVSFAGGFLAELNELVTGFSKYGTMLNIIFILAPGASAVRAVLGSFHRTEGDMAANENTLWESVVFEGVSYAVGFYLAFDAWEPLRPSFLWVKGWACKSINVYCS